jgi:hypothetical protein
MKTVNPYLLTVFLKPITGLADDDEAVMKFQSLGTLSEADYRKIIRDDLVQPFLKLPNKLKEKAKLSLCYYLNKKGYDFEAVFDFCSPPFDPPKDPRDFFLWIWQETFSGEECKLDIAEAYKEVNDMYEPTMLFMQKDK